MLCVALFSGAAVVSQDKELWFCFVVEQGLTAAEGPGVLFVFRGAAGAVCGVPSRGEGPVRSLVCLLWARQGCGSASAEHQPQTSLAELL